jgi:hypothetical protein
MHSYLIVNNKKMKSINKVFLQGVHIMKYLYNSFIIYDIRYFFSMKIIKQLKGSKINLGGQISKNLTKNTNF